MIVLALAPSKHQIKKIGTRMLSSEIYIFQINPVGILNIPIPVEHYPALL